ncbi:MAG: NfuA family Fe-S biogenesis protein [Xanthomonadales bacterium]|nr:Fe/S biogenesis protein NfuA [Xanthomonadales bacterium]MCC6592495.1 NfuA family Fe-S biogenesis protein [Xanthomonadales bacterium]MCE7932602.1 Fe-S biogenesis protein NfuA [Xanthomonadales bacterium PRO6]
MIEVADNARDYFNKLISQQGVPDLGIRLQVVQPGTPAGDCRLEFCEAAEAREDDYVIDCEGFSIYVDAASAPWLDAAHISFEHQRGGGQLTIRAPRLKGQAPGADASLVERVRHVLDSEINPRVAGHGGRVGLVEVSADGVVVLQFGGGCHGCSQVNMTLKHGVEKTLRERIPEISAVRDATDHASGAAPYYRRS